MTEVLSDVAGRKAADAATEEEFRSQLRGWLTDNHPGRRPRDATERLAWQKNWLANLFDAGFAGPSWPREYGGMDLPFAR
jgi:alkylation response protein AidB-like acyl-CoA dehydrogenase